MGFCSSCGTQLKEGAKFCAACGASASERAAVPVADTPPATAQSKSAAAEVSARRSASRKKPSKRAIIIAASAVAAVALIIIFAVPAVVEKPVPEGFVRISGGTFTMGTPESEPERNKDEVQHSVTLSSFYMGMYEVTQKEYRDITGNNPSKFNGDNLPVENVSWYDAVEYCNKRSMKEGLTPAYTIDKEHKDPNNTAPSKGKYTWEYDTVRWTVTWNKNANGYRLPTEAEWEYACRAGTTTPFNTGNNITTEQANYCGDYPYNGNAKGQYRKKTTAVGTFAPNQWGLYDIHGNVWEWCWDWYGDYPNGAQTNPAGAVFGSSRVSRGGGWCLNGSLRSAKRVGLRPAAMLGFLGFRLVQNAK